MADTVTRRAAQPGARSATIARRGEQSWNAQATKLMHDLLRALVAKKGSDHFLSATFPPAMKVDGRMTPFSDQPLAAQHTQVLARAIMNDKQANGFSRTRRSLTCRISVWPAIESDGGVGGE